MGSEGNDDPVRARPVEYHGFGAVQHETLAIGRRRAHHVMQIPARLELRSGEGQLQLPLHHSADTRTPNFAGGEALQHAAAEDHGGEVRLEDESLTELLHDDQRVDYRAPKAAVLFAEGEGKPAELRKLFPMIIAIALAAVRKLASSV